MGPTYRIPALVLLSMTVVQSFDGPTARTTLERARVLLPKLKCTGHRSRYHAVCFAIYCL